MSKVTKINLVNNTIEKDEGIPIIPIPDDVENPTFQHKTLGFPVAKWGYHNEDGKFVYVVCRYINKKTGNKVNLSWTYRKYKDGSRDWVTKSIESPRILFNLHHFKKFPDKTILVCEGEKAASAATELFPDYICTTSSNGAGSSHTCDWSPCKDRNVIVCPDNDEPGHEHAVKVAQHCLKVGAAFVQIINFPKDTFAEKWDLADDFPDGWTVADFQGLIDQAEIYVIFQSCLI